MKIYNTLSHKEEVNYSKRILKKLENKLKELKELNNYE